MLIAQVVVFDDNVVVRTPFVRAFVDDLKLEIHPSARAWDQVNRLWEVDPLYKHLAIEICKRYFDVEVDDQRQAQRQLQTSNPGDWAEVFFDAIPEHLHKRLYRLTCMALHPDHGGSTELIQTFTKAYAKRHK